MCLFDGEISLSGKVNFITSKDDKELINPLNSFNLITEYFFKNIKIHERVDRIAIEDSIYHLLQYGTNTNIFFSYPGFQSKYITINTTNVPSSSENHKNKGFKFSYGVDLHPTSNPNDPKKVGEVKYSEEKDLFEIIDN